MEVAVYAYTDEPGTSLVSEFGSNTQKVIEELRAVRAEMVLEDGVERHPAPEVYACNLPRPDIDQLCSVLSGDIEMGDRRTVATVEE